MKKYVKAIISVTAALCVAGAGLGVHYGYAKTTDKMTEYTIDTAEEPLKIAIISDLQLPDSASRDSHQYTSFESTLTMLNEKGMDALIIAGDFTDLGTKNAWQTFEEIYNKVMSDKKQPIPLYIMGNHDYWLDYFTKSWEIPTPPKMQKRFTKFTGEYPYSHKVINGYHFICWSSSDGSYDKSYNDEKWIRAELDKAVEDDPSKPIFVITHLNPTDTAYGSDEWGNDDIANILKDYSQVVSISGHSHYSLIDERSIWQDSFTAFTTQSLDYIELESGKYNGSVPKDAYGNTIADQVPGCLYMEIDSDKITINRLEANTGNPLKEPWVIEAPFGTQQSLSKYTGERAKANKPPVLNDKLNVTVSDITDVNSNPQKMISFEAGSDDDFVHSYRLEFLDESQNPIEFEKTDYDGNVIKEENSDAEMISQLLYFSDFILGIENMSKTVELRLPGNLPDNAKYVVITAIDSWQAESNSVTCELK
ncbi:MAG: metallophosphoesterase family protein [Eubacterium sp.]